MPASPSATQPDAPRPNGTRHNLHGPFRLLDGEDAAAFQALRRDLRGRHAPRGEAEAHWCDELARACWRQRRLFALEDAALAAPLAEAAEGAERLPSLATLARYRARVERDARLAREQLDALQAARPQAPASASAAQLRWLLARAQERATAEAADGTSEPEPATEPTAPRLNRHERRRLEALRRRGVIPATAA